MLRAGLSSNKSSSKCSHLWRRWWSTSRCTFGPASPKPAPEPSINSHSNNHGSSHRINRILRRTPKFLRPTLSALHNAPITHISAFLILHEITAIVPLLGLVGGFHYFHWLPSYFAEGKWVVTGVEKFGNYFRSKGWVDSEDQAVATQLAQAGRADMVEIKKNNKGFISRWWDRGETGTRLVVEFATAYAMVKLLLPLRLVVSVWGAPMFAQWTVVPFNNFVKRLVYR